MPTHPDAPGLEAFIVVDGQPCEEHNDRTPVARRSVERYIVVESGAIFEVHFRFSDPFPKSLPVSVVVTIDGKDMDEPLIRQSELYDKEGHVSVGPISNSGNDFRRQKYRFAELDIGEDVPACDIEAQKQKLADAGTISLHFYWLQTTHLNETFEMTEKEVQNPGVVHEKALKGEALSHTISLEHAERTEGVEYFDAEYANDGEPFAVFHFYYRSLKALKELHIIKRTPEPVDLIECDDEILQTSSPGQLRRMFAQWKRQEEIRQRLKRERSESMTVVGDDERLGDGSSPTANRSNNHDMDEDIVVLGVVDLRKERLKRRKPTEADEIIELD